MTIKEQLGKIKDNWFLILIVLVLIGIFAIGGNLGSMSYAGEASYLTKGYATNSVGWDADYEDEGFAPEVQERIKTHNARLSTQVEKGDFDNAVTDLKNIVTSSESYLLDEDISSYNMWDYKYKNGNFRIKVDTKKYDSVLSQLKDIGEIQSIYDNVDDITGKYTNLQIDIKTEENRLNRYKEMYEEAKDMDDKITLNDRIFELEKRIEYLKDRLENLDNQVSYSEIYFTISEKQSKYSGIVFVGFSELVRNLVGSINLLLNLLFSLLPWGIVAAVIYLIVKLTRKNKKK